MATPTLTNRDIRKLKAAAQRLEPVLRVGKSGLTDSVVQAIKEALQAQELIKIRFDHERDERDIQASRVADLTGAALIVQVGKVAVFYRPKPEAKE